MADRVVESSDKEVPEIPDLLERVLVYVLSEARGKLEAGEEVAPFTALAIKDKLFIETHPADQVEDCFKLAEHTVKNARGAEASGRCERIRSLGTLSTAARSAQFASWLSLATLLRSAFQSRNRITGPARPT